MSADDEVNWQRGEDSTGARIALFCLLIGAVSWLGSVTSRAVITFDLLQFGTLEFKPNIHPYVERMLYSVISEISLVSLIGYCIVWVSGVVYLRLGSLRRKEHGWLMMSAVLFFVFTPVEIYTGILDMRMWMLNAAGSNDLVEFRKLLIHRLGALSGVPIIALLCYYTIIFLVIFRVLRKPSPLSSPTGLN